MDQTLIMDKANRTYQLGLYEKAMPSDLSWEEKLNLTKESGFDYLEMSVDESDEKLAKLKRDYNQSMTQSEEEMEEETRRQYRTAERLLLHYAFRPSTSEFLLH